MSPPVLFLDVDGVLNRCGKSGQGLETDKVERLKAVLTRCPARIVLSSTWRKFDHALERVKREFLIESCTPVLDRQESGIWLGASRGREIQAWLDAHPDVTRFVILDDDSDMGPLTAHLVKTGSFEGLTENKAVELLERLQA